MPTATNQTIFPELVVSDFQKAIDWYSQVFEAKVAGVNKEEGGPRVLHSELTLENGNMIFVVDDFMQTARTSAEEGFKNPSAVHYQTADLDALWERMKQAGGAAIQCDLQVMFWGDKYGRFADPFGHVWSVGELVQLPREYPATQQPTAVEKNETVTSTENI